MELSQGTKKLLGQYQLWYQELQPKEAEAVLGVDTVAAPVSYTHLTLPTTPYV